MGYAEGEALVGMLLREEIARIIADAQVSGETLHAGYHAGLLAIAYAAANFSIALIIEELAVAATRAGVPVEITRPE